MAIVEQCGEKSEDGCSALVVVGPSSPSVEVCDPAEASTGRRSSIRLSGKKKTYYGPQGIPPQLEKTVAAAQKRTKHNHTEEVSIAPQNPHESIDSKVSADQCVTVCKNADVANYNGRESSRSALDEEKFSSHPQAETGMRKTAHIRVKETLRLFNTHYLQSVQEEEKRQADTNVPKPKEGKKKSEKAGARVPMAVVGKGEGNAKRASKRPDLKAITKMIQDKTILYPKRIGHLPGIDVGHQFFSRAEMVVLGVHAHWLNGIDYMGQSYSKLAECKGYKLPVAVCIVLSGMYEDDLDNSEDVVYTGQGGQDLLGSKHQIRDQKMVRGNLALKNSMENKLPVRVVRGHVSPTSYCGRVYTYDGLYMVMNYWAEKGVSGFTVYKYRLKRLDGQPVLTTNQVQFTRAQAPRSLSELRGLVAEDISGGQEKLPIPATNMVDDPPVAPTDYVYQKSVQVPSNLKLPKSDVGCNCKGDCIDPRICSCAKLNGSDFPYVRKDGGRLIEAKAVVFECGPSCACGPGCVNRTSQQGLKYRLEVFRTAKKGWAVRSWDTIPAGAPVCEYTGVLKRTDEAEENAMDNNYIFDIDCLQTMKGLDGRERRPGDVSTLVKESEKLEVPEFCIDAGCVGNVARFINHSCQPNLFVQCILSGHHDIKLAKVMLFAADTIPPLQELSYDYGYALDSVIGPDGTIKKLSCYCGASDCRKRMY